jgi:hypothetical protein
MACALSASRRESWCVPTESLKGFIKRDFISSRTKEALAKRKADGMKLGRPVGAAKNLKLDKHAEKIDAYLAKRINKVAIAKLLDVSPNTLYEWLAVPLPRTLVTAFQAHLRVRFFMAAPAPVRHHL